MRNLAFLTPKRTRACGGCGTCLERAPSWWTLCATCVRFHRFREALREFTRARP